MTNERSTIWVVSTREWYEVWASGQTRYEGSPWFRHIDGLEDVEGIVIRPSDSVIYGDVSSWSWPARRVIAERIALAKLAGDALSREGR